LQGAKPSRYATELLAIAGELRCRDWKSFIGHTAMAKAFTLEERLKLILEGRSARGMAGRIAYAKVAGTVGGLGIALVLFGLTVGPWGNSNREGPAPDCVGAQTKA
jgi:hypothetical protein